MASDLEQLLEMGFDKERAELAVKQSGGLQGAMDWLEKTQDTPLEELQEEAQTNALNTTELPEGTEHKSWVCGDCGKKLRNEFEVEKHALESEHANFSHSTEEIPPSTKEEIEARLKLAYEKRDKKRAAQEIEKKEHDKRNEQIKRKANKESQELKEELARKEQIKEAAKKRQDKQDDIDAKKRAKAIIEAQKEERRRKAEEAKALREGRPAPGAAPAAPAATATSSSSKANHDEARLRIEMEDGSKVMMKLPADTTLLELSQKLQQEHSVAELVQFELTFPKTIFLKEKGEFDQTLKDAKLTPTANLRFKTG